MHQCPNERKWNTNDGHDHKYLVCHRIPSIFTIFYLFNIPNPFYNFQLFHYNPYNSIFHFLNRQAKVFLANTFHSRYHHLETF